MVGLTNHVESLWGYFSLALVQRISSDGQLLTLDGAPRSEAGVGISVDYENDDQLAISIAVNPESRAGAADYLVIYGKHSRNAAVKDFDIWSVRIQAEAAQVPFLLYPTSTPGSFQVVPNLTPALSWQAVANATDYEVQLATNPSVVSAGGPYVTPTLTRRVGSATPALQLGVGDLQSDTVYYWQARAIFGAATGLYNTLTAAVGASGGFRTPGAAPASHCPGLGAAVPFCSEEGPDVV